MIGFVNGSVEAIFEDRVLVNTGAIGYNIFVPTSVINSIHNNEEVKLYTYLSVREDAMNLFGFLSSDELDMYKKLIGVSGIGPKAGLSILSVMSSIDLKYAIISGDHKQIAKAPGIGAKTAMKVILELKDKIDFDSLTESEENLTSSHSINSSNNENTKEAVMALVSLGYSQTDSQKAVLNVAKEDMTVEAIIKEALRKLI